MFANCANGPSTAGSFLSEATALGCKRVKDQFNSLIDPIRKFLSCVSNLSEEAPTHSLQENICFLRRCGNFYFYRIHSSSSSSDYLFV